MAVTQSDITAAMAKLMIEGKNSQSSPTQQLCRLCWWAQLKHLNFKSTNTSHWYNEDPGSKGRLSDAIKNTVIPSKTVRL